MTINIEGFGKITANKNTLNTLSMYISEASESYLKRDRPAMAKEAENASNKIYNELDKIGFYNDIRDKRD